MPGRDGIVSAQLPGAHLDALQDSASNPEFRVGLSMSTGERMKCFWRLLGESEPGVLRIRLSIIWPVALALGPQSCRILRDPCRKELNLMMSVW